jgi:hypothetical protein
MLVKPRLASPATRDKRKPLGADSTDRHFHYKEVNFGHIST